MIFIITPLYAALGIVLTFSLRNSTLKHIKFDMSTCTNVKNTGNIN